MSKIIDNIRAIRLYKGLSQDFMAQKLDIDVSTYGKIERGQIELTVNRLESIADIFKMDVMEMYGYMQKPSIVEEEPGTYERLPTKQPFEVCLTIKINDRDKEEQVLKLALGDAFLNILKNQK